MATSIPPHNLAEVVDALVYLISNPNCSIPDLMKFIPGPDFRTGGIIHGTAGLRGAYETARRPYQRPRPGRDRGSQERQEDHRHRRDPLQPQTRTNLIERIAELVKEDQSSGISDVRDLSSRDGHAHRDRNPQGEDTDVILNQLYAMTPRRRPSRSS